MIHVILFRAGEAVTEEIALCKACIVSLLGFFWTTDIICLPIRIPYCSCPWIGKCGIAGCGAGFQSRVCLWRGISSVLLPTDIHDDAVREHFGVCGDVVGVRVVRDRRTGLGKGFGYVLFEVGVNSLLQHTGGSSKPELGLPLEHYYSLFSYFLGFVCTMLNGGVVAYGESSLEDGFCGSRYKQNCFRFCTRWSERSDFKVKT